MRDKPLDRRTVTISEYGQHEFGRDDLTPGDLRLLDELVEAKALRTSETRRGLRVEASSVVGVLNFERFRLVIEPKVGVRGDRLIDWLRYALGTPVAHRPTSRHWQTSADGFADLVVAALVDECQGLLRAGLRRDYVPNTTVSSSLRGRLDLRTQLVRGHGRVDRLHLRTFEREEAIWENLLCGAALRAAARLTTDPSLVRAARRTAEAFPHVDTPGSTSALLRTEARARYNRLNRRYRSAHAWAGLLLRQGGVSDLLLDAGHRAGSLLLRMEVLWERVVVRLASDAAERAGGSLVPSNGATAITVRGDGTRRKPFRPDALLRLAPAIGHVAVDAKYKRYDTRNVTTEDVHQMLTYVAGYASDARTAIIVFPSPGSAPHRTLTVQAPGGVLATIEVVGLDITRRPEDLVPELLASLPLPGV